MTTPKDWMKAGFPGFAELCDRQGMKVVSEGKGPRGEWEVGMQSTRFSLSIGEELGVRSYFPTVWIRLCLARNAGASSTKFSRISAYGTIRFRV